jgi:hypothetical protein
MQFYRCKCGATTAHTTMGVPRCDRCPKCGSDLAQSPSHHSDPEPHKWVTKYDRDTGAPYEVCTSCHRSRSDLEAEEREHGAKAEQKT